MKEYQEITLQNPINFINATLQKLLKVSLNDLLEGSQIKFMEQFLEELLMEIPKELLEDLRRSIGNIEQDSLMNFGYNS